MCGLQGRQPHTLCLPEYSTRKPNPGEPKPCTSLWAQRAAAASQSLAEERSIPCVTSAEMPECPVSPEAPGRPGQVSGLCLSYRNMECHGSLKQGAQAALECQRRQPVASSGQ